MAIDVAKYISWKLNKNLVSIPTILSVDAFTTPAAGVRVNHDVEYLGIASPNPLIIDYDLLRSAPKELNIAGVGDLFSIHTASYDWQYANSKGKSEYPYSQQAIDDGKKILDFIYDNIGNIIGLGIYLLSRLQKNDPLFITEMMDESGLTYHPNSMDIEREDLRDSLLSLKSYVKSKDKLWFTIIDDSSIDEEWINENLSDLKFK